MKTHPVAQDGRVSNLDTSPSNRSPQVVGARFSRYLIAEVELAAKDSSKPEFISFHARALCHPFLLIAQHPCPCHLVVSIQLPLHQGSP